jgi:hypothetical protein
MLDTIGANERIRLETPHTPEECLSKAQFFQKVDRILFP